MSRAPINLWFTTCSCYGVVIVWRRLPRRQKWWSAACEKFCLSALCWQSSVLVRDGFSAASARFSRWKLDSVMSCAPSACRDQEEPPHVPNGSLSYSSNSGKCHFVPGDGVFGRLQPENMSECDRADLQILTLSVQIPVRLSAVDPIPLHFSIKTQTFMSYIWALIPHQSASSSRGTTHRNQCVLQTSRGVTGHFRGSLGPRHLYCNHTFSPQPTNPKLCTTRTLRAPRDKVFWIWIQNSKCSRYLQRIMKNHLKV